MRKVAATQARRDWFRLLDEVAQGEVVVIERAGRLLELRRRESDTAPEAIGYQDVLQVPDLDRADSWSWEWQEPGQPLALRADSEP